MLENHKNLWVNLSWVTYEQQIVASDGTPRPEW